MSDDSRLLITDSSDAHGRAAVAGPLRADSLAESVVILVALTGVQRLIGFGRSVLFCRWLDPDQLGLWDMALSFLMLAAPIAVLSLPGAFKRYVEHYRQQGQLRALLRRTTLCCAVLAALTVIGVCLRAAWFSRLIFAKPDQVGMVLLVTVSLLGVISFNFLTELATALRKVRLVSVIQLVHSLAFALLGACLVLCWQASAQSVVLAYGAACVIASLWAAAWLRRAWQALPAAEPPLAQRALWSKLLPFAAWLWTVNLLANLFDVADRYMLLHYSRAADPLALLGQYHSSRLVPLLLVSVSTMLAGMITPHLSADWEAGRRDRVSLRLNLFLKLMAYALTLGGVLILLAAPLLFQVALRGKFAGGQAILPWTLTCCVWFSLAMAALNYIWCIEKARLGTLALLVGLVVNVLLNFLLLPRLGLLGAVLAASFANLVMLALISALSSRRGFRMDRGTWLMFGVPPVVCLGPWVALLMLITLAAEAILSDRLLTADEKRLLGNKWREYAGRLRTLQPGRQQPASNG